MSAQQADGVTLTKESERLLPDYPCGAARFLQRRHVRHHEKAEAFSIPQNDYSEEILVL
jgi:hypothetical protein